MPYVAARHITYNGVVYERGEVVPVTEETLGRIESYLSTKTLTFMEKVVKNSGPKPLAVETHPEPVVEVIEEPAAEVEASEDFIISLTDAPAAE